jgi:DNA-binding transcriptional regulator LsrR (DeoR family)
LIIPKGGCTIVDAKYDIHIMVQVAQMYYMDGFTQEKIANQLGISRSSISMILSEARDFGIVDIRIKNPQTNNDELSEKMIQMFGISKCYVIPINAKLVRILTKIIATQGAFIAEKEIKSHSSLGVAWGTTCYECMMAFRNNTNLYDVHVVPLIGGTNRIASEYQLNEMVRIMAEKLQGMPSFIYAPALADTIEDKQLYMKSMPMQDIVQVWKSLDIALVSVGAPPEYYNSKQLFDPFDMKKTFEADPMRPVGDICARRFNINGEFLKNDYNQKIMGIDEEALKCAEKVICIASGNHKILSILGALRTDIIDVLITDENTAQSILEVSKT